MPVVYKTASVSATAGRCQPPLPVFATSAADLALKPMRELC